MKKVKKIVIIDTNNKTFVHEVGANKKFELNLLPPSKDYFIEKNVLYLLGKNVNIPKVYEVDKDRNRIEEIDISGYISDSFSPANPKIHSLVKHTCNSDAKTVKTYVTHSEKLKIEAVRKDWVAERYGPKGIKTGIYFLYCNTKQPLPYADNLINLNSQRITSEKGVTVYSATWIRFGQFLYEEYYTESGYIAEYKGIFYHLSDTKWKPESISDENLTKIIKSVKRKEKRNGERIREEKKQNILKKRFQKKIKRLNEGKEKLLKGYMLVETYVIPSNMIVTKKDSLDYGYCEPGTNMFINRHFNFFKKKSVVKELLEKAGNNNRQLNALILHIAKKKKKAVSLQKFLEEHNL